MSGAVDQVDFGDLLLNAICEAYGCLRGGPKILASDANSSEAAAENWLRRRNQPRGGNLIALMAASPAINDLVLAEVSRRRAETATKRAAWRNRYDAALHRLAAAQGGGDSRPAGLALSGAAGWPDDRGGVVLSVDRRRG